MIISTLSCSQLSYEIDELDSITDLTPLITAYRLLKRSDLHTVTELLEL
jgi:hypothetical protein